MSWQKIAWCLLVVLMFNSPSSAESPKKVLLLGQSPDDHPPQTHEYMAGMRVLGKCLKPLPGMEVTIVRADDPWKEGPELLQKADGVVLFLSQGARWISSDPKRREAFAKLAARGGGLVALHWAIGCQEAKPIDSYLKLLGGCHGGPDRKFKVVEEKVHIVNPHHPVTFGISPFQVREEFYYRLKFVKPEGSIQPVLQVPIDGQMETVAWSWERPDGGRSFGFSGLHFHDNWRLEAYRRLVTQAVLWTLKMPIPQQGIPVEVPEDDFKLK